MLRMYTLCLAGIIAVGLGTAGCGGSNHRAGGSFQATWILNPAGYGATDCQTAGVVEVDLDVQDIRTQLAYSDAFNCSEFPANTTTYTGISQLLPVSNYSIALRAYNTFSATTALSEALFPVIAIQPNTTVQLPPATLTF